MSGAKDANTSSRHHEPTDSAQKTFFETVSKRSPVLQEMGNPFHVESADLLVLDIKDIANPAVAEMIDTTRVREAKISFSCSLREGS